jgi:hypothetical protein
MVAGSININNQFTVASNGDVVANNIVAQGQIIALAGSDISGDYLSDGDLSADLDLTSAGSISANYSPGVSGWAIDGLGNAEFNNATIRGAIAGGTIDIGGADSSSFHVNANGDLWLGAATAAAAPFEVSRNGAVRTEGIDFYDQPTIGPTATMGNNGTSYFGIQTEFPLYLITPNTMPVEIWAGLERTARFNDGGALALYASDSAANQSTNIQFFDGAATPVRSGYVGFPGNAQLRMWNEESTGTLLFGTDSTQRAQITAAGALVMGSESLLEPITHQFFVQRTSNPAMQVIHRSAIANDPHGIDIFLGLSGNTSNPGADCRFIRFRRGDSTIVGRIEGTGGGVAYQTTSDRALKTDITDDVSVGAAAFDKIPWRSFRWTEDGRPGHGVIAQQLAKVPEWAFSVSKGKTFWEEDPQTGKKHRTKELWGVDYVPFIGAIGAKLADVDRRLRALEER